MFRYMIYQVFGGWLVVDRRRQERPKLCSDQIAAIDYVLDKVETSSS